MPWDTVRREVAGAWRSVRYDLDHRSKADVESKSTISTGPRSGLGGSNAPLDPDATAIIGRLPVERQSTVEQQSTVERQSIWAPLRNPRRLMATLSVASAITASALGTFFAVTGGLGILLVDSHGAPSTPQPVPASAPQVVASETARPYQLPASTRPSPSASVRVSPTAARPTGSAKPSPSATATASPSPSPSHSPAPKNSLAATPSDTPSPNVTPPADTTP